MTQFNATIIGEGKPVVLIHGFPLNKNLWKNFTEPLSKIAKVIVIDLPGFGESDPLESPFSLTDVARNILEWLDEKEFENPVVVGHSLGGYIALAMAELNPQRIDGFVLFHSTAYADSSEKKENRTKVIDFIEKNGVQTFTSNFIPPLFADPAHPAIEMVRNMAITSGKETVIAYTLAMRDRPDRTSVLKQFPKPILIIAGEKDNGIPLESLKVQSQLSPTITIEIFPDCAHMGMLEKPEKSLEALENFLQKVTSR